MNDSVMERCQLVPLVLQCIGQNAATMQIATTDAKARSNEISNPYNSKTMRWM